MRHLLIIILLGVCQWVGAQTRVDYFMHEAARCMVQGQVSSAADLYQHCLEIEPSTAEAIFHLGRMKFYLGEDSLGMEYLYKAVELDSCNCSYLETLATILINQRCVDEALPLLERMSKLQAKRSDVLSMMAKIYANVGRMEDAIQTMNRLELLEGKLPSISFEKFNLYMEMSDSVNAFRELEELCAEYPADMSNRIHMGYQYQLLGNFEQALKIYDEVKKVDPSNPTLQMAMLDYYNMQGMDSLYTTTRDSILFSPSTDSQKRAMLMENIIESSPADSASTEAIMMRFNRILEVVPNDVQMLMLNAIYMEYRKFPPADIAMVMQRVLDVQPDQETAMRWLAQYHIAQRDLSAIEEICRRGVNYYPSNLTYYYFLALPLMNSGNYEESIETLARGLRLRAEDTKAEIISDVYTQKGDCYYEMGKHEEAFLQYDSALVYNKDNVLCLNNYAYFLSLLNKDLGKAEEMSYRAIKLEPDNRTYLDTYAWILFMQEQYAEAERYMERVVPRDSSEHYLLTDDYTGSAILEHAGDIAWMNGDTQRAIYLWQLAAKRGDADVTPLLPKKARKKKYYK